MRRVWIHLALFLAVFSLGSCSRDVSNTTPIVIFHAGSLSIPLQAVEVAFEAEYPQYDVRREAAGSRTSARKITDLARACDVMISADIQVIEDLLMPEHASWAIPFARNELCIAYRKNAIFLQDLLATGNWPGILAQKYVRVGRSDPDSDPCGYYTVQALQLADAHYGTAYGDAILDNSKTYVRPKSADLMALLESHAIDYAFVYRSVAEQHGLDYIALPPEVHLGDPSMAEMYASVSAEVAGDAPGRTVSIAGKPIVYGLTITKKSVHPGAAELFVQFLLDPNKGLGLLNTLHQKTVTGLRAPGYGSIPPALKSFAAAESDDADE